MRASAQRLRLHFLACFLGLSTLFICIHGRTLPPAAQRTLACSPLAGPAVLAPGAASAAWPGGGHAVAAQTPLPVRTERAFAVCAGRGPGGELLEERAWGL